MIKRVTLLLSMILFSHLALGADTLDAQLSRKKIADNETVHLTLTYTGDYKGDTPDFSSLEKDFKILGTSHSTQLSVINNVRTSTTRWSVSLIPKHRGDINIPGFTLGHAQSQPLNLHVSEYSDTDPQGALKEVFLRTSVNQAEPYLQSQVIYTLKVFYKRNIQHPELTEPTTDNATIMLIGNDHNYSKVIDGEAYQVLERNYAIIPQKTGQINIQGPILKGSILETENVDSGVRQFFNSQWKRITIPSQPIELLVKPIPSTAKGTWWLPAKKLKIYEEWSEDLNNIETGQPITRTITIEAVGLMAEQLPEINVPILDNVNIYTDKPILEMDTDGSNILSTRIEKFAILAKQAGQIEFPAINIPWWDTTTNKPMVATIPKHTINISGEAIQQTPMAPIKPTTTKQDFTEAYTPVTLDMNQVRDNSLWIYATVVLLFLWVTTIIYFKSREPKPKKGETLEDIKARRMYSKFKQACFNNDPVEAKDNLIGYLHSLHPDGSIRSLADIYRFNPSKEFRRATEELNEIIYADKDVDWDGQAYFKLMKPCFKDIKPGIKPKDDGVELRELYPQENKPA